MQRVELFCCTNMSENKGISSVTEYIEYAVKNKAIAVGIVDFNTTQSFITAQEYIQNKNIKNLAKTKWFFVVQLEQVLKN